jgi:hypothetical protein
VDLRGEGEEIDMAYKQEQGEERMKMHTRKNMTPAQIVAPSKFNLLPCLT